MAGPLIPLLIGFAGHGIGVKRRRERLLDQEAKRQDAINELDIGLGAAVPNNQFDQEKLAIMHEQFIDAQGQLRSNDPALQRLGATRIAALDSALRQATQQNETEARAEHVRELDAEVAAAGAAKAGNERRFDQELTMNSQLNTELKSYKTAELAYAKVTNLLDNNDQLATLAGLTAFVQAIDNSVVREGELLKYQGANGFITQLVNQANKSEGRDFDPDTRRSIRNAAAALMNAEKSKALSITNSYQDRALSFGLDPKRVLSGVNDSLYTEIPIDRDAQNLANAEADAAAAAAAEGEFVREDEATRGIIGRTFEDMGLAPPSFGNAMAIIADQAVQSWQQTGRALRGATLHIQPETGEIWEKSAEGEWTKLRGTPGERRRAEIFRLQNDVAQPIPPATDPGLDFGQIQPIRRQ